MIIEDSSTLNGNIAKRLMGVPIKASKDVANKKVNPMEDTLHNTGAQGPASLVDVNVINPLSDDKSVVSNSKPKPGDTNRIDEDGLARKFSTNKNKIKYSVADSFSADAIPYGGINYSNNFSTQ
jgi:hypothetical protein